MSEPTSLTSDPLLARLRKRVEIARTVESNVSLHPDQVVALVECAEALKALNSNKHLDLGDRIYDVREREGEGWEGPSVKQWNAAVMATRHALAKLEAL